MLGRCQSKKELNVTETSSLQSQVVRKDHKEKKASCPLEKSR